jgi:hypothetical protein
MPPQGAINISVPFAALDIFRFACGEGKKDHDVNAQGGVHRILHFIEFKLSVKSPLSTERTRTVHAAATDGHRLAHYWWNLEAGEQFLGGPFYVDSREIKTFLSQFPTNRQFELDYQLVKAGPQIFLKTEGQEAFVGSSGTLEYQYPDYPTIFPKVPKVGATAHPVSLDGAYLEDLVRYKKNQNQYYRARRKVDPQVKWPGPDGLGLCIYFREPLPSEDKTILPAKITYETELLIGNIEFLLMPREWKP